jgi:hypothetical protein
MIPAFHYTVVDANNQQGSTTITIPQPITHPNFRTHAMLVDINHTDKQQSFAVDCYVSAFVQNQLKAPVHAQVFSTLDGTGSDPITEIFCTVSVNGCSARAIFITEYF